MLTDTAARNARPGPKDYKLADAGGLYLFVTTKGHRSWRWKFRINGKEKRLVLGAYPVVGLKAAREARDAAKSVLKEGRDPAAGRRRGLVVPSAGRTFEDVATEWFEHSQDRWKPVHADDVITSMKRDLFPSLGAMALSDVNAPTLLATLRQVEARGAIETAHRLRQRAERVFKYAVASGLCDNNPAASIGEAMKPKPAKRRWPAITDIDPLRELLRAVDTAAASPVTRLASRFLALTAQRPGNVHRLRWEQVKGVDWTKPSATADEATWHIPAANMKQELALREDYEFDHVVPLPKAAIDALRAARTLTGRGPFVFPSAVAAHKRMSENALNALYHRLGYKGVHVAHGWRSSFSTIMNERAERTRHGDEALLIDRLIVDLMLAHRPSGMSESEFRYNRARYMARRRELACDWADLLLEDALPATDLLQGRRRSMPK